MFDTVWIKVTAGFCVNINSCGTQLLENYPIKSHLMDFDNHYSVLFIEQSLEWIFIPCISWCRASISTWLTLSLWFSPQEFFSPYKIFENPSEKSILQVNHWFLRPHSVTFKKRGPSFFPVFDLALWQLIWWPWTEWFTIRCCSVNLSCSRFCLKCLKSSYEK